MFTLYLKSIEIQGFKSFPMQTRLTFDRPITAVVGPNGSGKSNIADALLWVMGEQSTKTLRGGKMEDVIFGGTLRRPQQNFAEVSLILDNSEGELDIDTNEVMITRRYYRSGDSEYYINKSAVRLKDITELLMDTGLGREGYSIIGQGKIDEIISVKGKERREIFDEAAGISRYRHKKEEAERKLQNTEDNLVRINDRISELEIQREPLREQAEDAKKYNLLSGELRGVEISLWLKELETIEARTEKVENDYLSAKREADAAKLEYEEAFGRQDSLFEMIATNEKEAQTIRDKITEITGNKSEVESNIAVLKSQQTGNLDQIESIKSGLKSHEEQHDGVGTQISGKEVRLTEIDIQKNAKDEEIAQLDNEFEEIVKATDDYQEAHKVLLNREQKLQAEYSEKKSELSALAAGAQELIDSEQTRKQKLSDAREDLKIRETEYNQAETELTRAKEEITSLENVMTGLALKLDGKTKKADASGETYERLTSEYNSLISRQALLSEMEKEYQGYGKAVKIVMQEQARGTLRNIHGTVASLIKTDDIYTKAIEIALGGKMQDIVVDTEEDAKAVKSLLERRDARTTVQPISTVKGTALNESEFRNDDGYIGLAINLIRFDKKYTGIYTNLLGRVLICEDLNSAIKIARKHGHKYRIVTLDGQVMNAGGSMTVGSATSGTGMLSRANELESLEKRIEKCKSDLDNAEHEHTERIREKNAAQYEHDTAEDELRAAGEKVKLLELEQSHREQNLNNAKILIDTLKEEVASYDNRITQNTADTENLKVQIAKIEAEIASVKDEIDEAIKGNEHIRKERERITDARSEIRADISALEAEKETIKNSLKDLKNIREEISGNKQLQMDNIKKIESDNEKIRADILEKEREMEMLEEKISSFNTRLKEIETGKFEFDAKRNEINDTIKLMTDKYNDKQRKVSSLELKRENIKTDETVILDRLWNTYELSRSAAVNHGTPIESISTAKKRINTLKREITALGAVNIGAIDAFEKLDSRYNDYTTQRDDVEKAKTELLGIIEEITSRMKEIFIREFDLISESFKKTFKELFGGGQASLTLEDPEDVLNCGIEIQVQPPGKNLKSISLLSGGEKAFVAIAIYFAILSVRPPPFVVMDEIDAALDDANVLRFSDYMRFMSDKSQMIVITHKRGTMEEADVLYGVTMQELGVSNILCVDIDEAEKHINSKNSNRVNA